MSDVKFNLRLPRDLYDQLADEADFHRVSRNAVVIAALRNYLPYQLARRPKVVVRGSPVTPLREPPVSSRVPESYDGAPDEMTEFQQEFQRRAGQKVAPNDPCPCGKPLKYTRCHGAPGQRR